MCNFIIIMCNLCGHLNINYFVLSCDPLRILIRILEMWWRRSNAIPSLERCVKLWLCLAMTGKTLRHILSRLAIIFAYWLKTIHAKQSNLVLIKRIHNFYGSEMRMLSDVKHHMFRFKVQILTKECGKIFERDKAYEPWQVSLCVPPTHMVHVI